VHNPIYLHYAFHNCRYSNFSSSAFSNPSIWCHIFGFLFSFSFFQPSLYVLSWLCYRMVFHVCVVYAFEQLYTDMHLYAIVSFISWWNACLQKKFRLSQHFGIYRLTGLLLNFELIGTDSIDIGAITAVQICILVFDYLFWCVFRMYEEDQWSYWMLKGNLFCQRNTGKQSV